MSIPKTEVVQVDLSDTMPDLFNRVQIMESSCPMQPLMEPTDMVPDGPVVIVAQKPVRTISRIVISEVKLEITVFTKIIRKILRLQLTATLSVTELSPKKPIISLTRMRHTMTGR